ncbi:MurT ligase domain-containing protein [uncultured Slackia sp.]|uniref:MurT ligase domain-containing protein n=1 Tax=uncultured Slackia sp. TaxID=665903 RepID=UPI0025D8874F|nr:MurT ligase domain-containing protein [uncultured Slackia sp.]
MGFRSKLAAFAGRAARWGGETFMHRAAGNIPGAIALKIDPLVLTDLARQVDPVIVVSGTNGKTTTTNLIADCLATSGRPLVCNREGNNLQSGVVTALLVGPEKGNVREAGASSTPKASPDSQTAVGAAVSAKPIVCFECDELYTKFVLPRVKPRYFMLLNLFRDQLDRFGEIDRIQDVIAEALLKTPETIFIYNGDDPLCAAIADRVSNRSFAFGIKGDLGLSADRVSDSRFCQKCGGVLEYEYVHYDKLGAYRCKECGWGRPELKFAAENVRATDEGFVFDIDGHEVRTGQTGVYMVYNVLAAYAASKMSFLVEYDGFQKSVLAYRPTNGRLQVFDFGERSVMTNLAKNPTGFNQNIRIVLQEQGRVLALFVNDNDPDGHDVSWFWDIDFENWAHIEGLKAFVGGSRANDMQVRLKYAGIKAQIVDNVAQVMEATCAEDGRAYIIANYTALPEVRRELEKLHAEWESTGNIPWSEQVSNSVQDSQSDKAQNIVQDSNINEVSKGNQVSKEGN